MNRSLPNVHGNAFGNAFGAVQGSGQSVGINPSFVLPLSDAGTGVVNITPTFAQGSPTPTFTRATTAYTRLANGVWALIASGSPRSIYSAAGVYLGYQAEGARANVLGGTDAIVRTMSDVGWVVGATLTVGTAVGVDGVADACALLTGGAVAATNTILFTTVLASAARTYSVRVRRVSGTGAVNITDNGGTNWTALTGLSATEQLFQITRTQANPVVGVQVEGNGDSVAVDFNTIEAASFANPTPIPVNVSKAADVLTYVVAGNVNAAAGTILLDVTGVPNASNPNTYYTNMDTAGNHPAVFVNAGNLDTYDGTTQAASVPYTASQTTVQKIAVRWGAAGIQAFNGGTAGTIGAFDGALNVGTNFAITGLATGNMPFGGTKNFRIYKSQLSAATVQSLTT